MASALRLRPVIAACGLAIAVACAPTTPTAIMRLELPGDDRSTTPICERLAQDFDMRLAPTSAAGVATYRKNFAARAITGRGVNFVISARDASGANPCASMRGGITCAVSGPGLLQVETPAGRGEYQILAGQAASVRTAGPQLICETSAGA